MFMKRFFVGFFIFAFCFFVFAIDDAVGDGFDYVSLMGMELSSLIELYGVPVSVYSVRGDEEWQDDVVFDYGGFAVFLWENRVWQIVFYDGFEHDVEGLVPGMSWDSALAATSDFSSVSSDDAKIVFVLPRWSYPVRLVLVREGDVLSDIYIYRSDF